MDQENKIIADDCQSKENFSAAFDLYTKCLEDLTLDNPEKKLQLLLERSRCSIKLKRYENVIEDCHQILQLTNGFHPATQNRLIFALFHTGRYNEAKNLALEWVKNDPLNPEADSTLQKLTRILESSEGFKNEHYMVGLENSQVKANLFSPDHTRRELKLKNELRKDYYCAYCSLVFPSEEELRAHCKTESHRLIIMSDEGREWKYRAPPRGLSGDQLSLCQTCSTNAKCKLGQQCCDAHSDEELAEWKERFVYRHTRLQSAKENKLHGISFIEYLLDKLANTANKDSVMKENVDNIEVKVNPELDITASEKKTRKEWTLNIKSKFPLRQVALLYDTHRTHFFISSLSVINSDDYNVKEYVMDKECQEWMNPSFHQSTINGEIQYIFQVVFRTSIFGTFRQAIVFDFGIEPLLVKNFSVNAIPVTDSDKLQKHKKSISFVERWDADNTIIVPFENSPYILGERELYLLSTYPSPQPRTFEITQASTDSILTEQNYYRRFHELLYSEEMHQHELLSRYNIRVHLMLSHSYQLHSRATTVVRYSQSGELYACLKLTSVLSEDSAPGRLILASCNTVFVSPVTPDKSKKRKAYEAIIEDKGKTSAYIRLSKHCVQELDLNEGTDLLVEVQFQLNRLPLCEMHFAIDRLYPVSLVFPDLNNMPPVPWNPQQQWSNMLDSRMNPKQKEAVLAITTPLETVIPPILIIGPYGTGKTFTLAQAVKLLVQDPRSRVLLCTHSNSAADIYIQEYLHLYVTEGHPEARPLRIYYQHRWISTVNPIVLQYCLLTREGQNASFVLPSIEDVQKYKVIVCTYSTSRCLSELGLDKGFFTHILLDEAAQAMECETVMALSLASNKTRIVLAGDHMQLSPEVYSKFAQEKNLHMSLLERLYDYYPGNIPCKVMLSENYRSHDAIIQYTSELFYDNRLLASGQQPRHDTYYPLTFFAARGEDKQDSTSTAFHNNSEVYEIVDRVTELQKSWPKAWGELDENSIGIVSPYYDQVSRIRTELRKRKMRNISVERVLNVQGKQFRVIILSTVRTFHTCKITDLKVPGELDADHGFLSDAKLLNTAITRGQSLVAVVGDPVSLCCIGKCRKLWEKFIGICDREKSLFGITWSSLQSTLDAIELRSSSVLNPLAPEFVPRRMWHRQQMRLAAFAAAAAASESQGHSPRATVPSRVVYPSVTQVSMNVLPQRPAPQNSQTRPSSYNAEMIPVGPIAYPSPVPNMVPPFVFHRPQAVMPTFSPGSGFNSKRLVPVKDSSMLPFQRGSENKEIMASSDYRDLHGENASVHNVMTSKDEGAKEATPGKSEKQILSLRNEKDKGQQMYLNEIMKCPIRPGSEESNSENMTSKIPTKLHNGLAICENQLNRNGDGPYEEEDILSSIFKEATSINDSEYSFRDAPTSDKSLNPNSTTLTKSIWSFPFPSERAKPNNSMHLPNEIPMPMNNMECFSKPVISNTRTCEPNLSSVQFPNHLHGKEEFLPKPGFSQIHNPPFDPVPQQHQMYTEKFKMIHDDNRNFESCFVGRVGMPMTPQACLNQLQLSLKEKLSLLEKIIPPNTDIRIFVNSLQQQKEFYFYLTATEGTVVAKRFASLISNIRRDLECIEHLQMGNHPGNFMSNRFPPDNFDLYKVQQNNIPFKNDHIVMGKFQMDMGVPPPKPLEVSHPNNMPFSPLFCNLERPSTNAIPPPEKCENLHSGTALYNIDQRFRNSAHDQTILFGNPKERDGMEMNHMNIDLPNRMPFAQMEMKENECIADQRRLAAAMNSTKNNSHAFSGDNDFVATPFSGDSGNKHFVQQLSQLQYPPSDQMTQCNASVLFHPNQNHERMLSTTTPTSDIEAHYRYQEKESSASTPSSNHMPGALLHDNLVSNFAGPSQRPRNLSTLPRWANDPSTFLPVFAHQSSVIPPAANDCLPVSQKPSEGMTYAKILSRQV